MLKPFSALYYVRHNLRRSLVLIFLVFISYTAYLGGLYVTNPKDNFVRSACMMENYALFHMTYMDTGGVEFEKAKAAAADLDGITCVNAGGDNSLQFMAVMHFTMNCAVMPTFHDAEAFEKFNDVTHCLSPEQKPADGQVYLTSMMARNANLQVGDVLSSDNSDYGSFMRDFTVGGIIESETYYALFFDYEHQTSSFMLLNTGLPTATFEARITDFSESYTTLFVQDKGSTLQELDPQFRPFLYIYVAILVLLSVVLAITINASFVGAYEKRRYEFAVYHGIGFTKGKLILKIAMELLFTMLTGLLAGGILFFVGLYLLNHLVLEPNGQYLRYFHPVAIIGLLLCNVLIFLPMFLFRLRWVKKLDICAY